MRFVETLCNSLHNVILLMVDRLSFSTFLFGNFQSNIVAIFSGPPCTTDMLYTSLKSPNMQLPESEIKLGVATSRGLSRPLKCDYLFRVTIFKGRLTLKELR